MPNVVNIYLRCKKDEMRTIRAFLLFKHINKVESSVQNFKLFIFFNKYKKIKVAKT